MSSSETGSADGKPAESNSPPRIISASRRTDIPALYAPWFRARLDARYCTVPNPFNAAQVARVSLKPEDVLAFVFWTRHARPMFDVLPVLEQRGYRFYFLYTITGYGPPLEARTPPRETAQKTFRDLARRLPPGAVVWRYDPIVLGEAFPPRFHHENFARIAAALEGRAERVIVSLMHPYRKTRRRLGRALSLGRDVDLEPPGVPALMDRLARIARDHGMRMEACSQPADFAARGVPPAKCVDNRLLADLFGGDWNSNKDPGQRPECGCVPSKDIGIPDTCTFGCRYCYATRSDDLARRRRRESDIASPSMWGHWEKKEAAD